MIDKLKDPKVRKYLYNVIGATIPLLVLTGFVIPQASELLLLLAAAILGVSGAGLASVNTPLPQEQLEELEAEIEQEGLGR